MCKKLVDSSFVKFSRMSEVYNRKLSFSSIHFVFLCMFCWSCYFFHFFFLFFCFFFCFAEPVVFDNGSGVLKAGFAGDDRPKSVFPSFVGRPKHTKVMAGVLEGDFFVGDRAEAMKVHT